MDNKGVLVCGEIAEGKLAPITLALLGAGRKLADKLGEGLSVLLMGSTIGGAGREAIAYQADRVYLADDPLLESYNSDAYALVATDLCRKVLPGIVLLGQTDIGRDLAPRLVYRLKGGLAMDCVDLDIDPGNRLLLQTRPVFGGNALATVVTRTARPQMATIRLGAMAPAERNDSRQGEVVAVPVTVDPSAVRTRVVQRVKEQVEGIRLEEAEVVVTGGRGVGSAQNFDMVRELARVLGGAVGGTRAVCEEGWLPGTLQIGQTGKIVSPKIYFAVALSGAMQHIAGCSGAKCIVAVNKDPDANIFKVAQYGIVGDFKDVVPALTEKLKQLLAR